MNNSRFEQVIGNVRFAALVAVLASALGSLLMFLIGGTKVYFAFSGYLEALFIGSDAVKLSSNAAIDYMVQAIDAFLIAVVLMIFGGGIYNLFIREVDTPEPGTKRLLEIKNISQLKRVLAEVIVVILMVRFLEEALNGLDEYRWEMLILPAAVLMMAIAVRALNLKEL